MLYRTAFVVFLTLVVLVTAAISDPITLIISPVRVSLTLKKRSTIVEVTDAGNAPTTVQVHVARWTMRGDEFKYIETDQFIVNPPVFTLQPGQKQLVRLSLRSEVGVEIEGSYRLILEQVPTTVQPGTVAMLLNISIPVFVLPAQPVMPRLIWQASYTNTGNLKLTVRNDGTAHEVISKVSIQTDGREPSAAEAIQTSIGGYLLPGNSREFVLSDDRLRSARHVILDVVTETTKTHMELTPTERRE